MGILNPPKVPYLWQDKMIGDRGIITSCDSKRRGTRKQRYLYSSP